MPLSLRALALVGLALAAACRPAAPHPEPATPAALAQSLLAADRAFAREAQARTLPLALRVMFTSDVRMPAPRGEILVGSAKVEAAIAATPDSTARASWTPIRVGLSADGLQGFTVGFLTTTRPDGSRAQFKYLAYWVRLGVSEGGSAWRVTAWRRRPMELVPIDSAPLPPLLPTRMVARTTDERILAAQLAELRAAEGEFSALANRIGVGAAFAQRGTDASINVGPPSDGRFTVGAEAIARAVSGGQPLDAPSTITWGADTAIVASSGDLGITFGVIRPKNDARAPGSSFFTIWRKSNGVWRYVAE